MSGGVEMAVDNTIQTNSKKNDIEVEEGRMTTTTTPPTDEEAEDTVSELHSPRSSLPSPPLPHDHQHPPEHHLEHHRSKHGPGLVSSSPGGGGGGRKQRSSMKVGVPPGPIKRHSLHHMYGFLARALSGRRSIFEKQQEEEVVETPPEKKSKDLTVNFGSLQIREYPIDIGSGGVTRFGTPIGISWEYVDETIHPSVIDYEDKIRGKPPKPLKDLKLASILRSKILHNQGCSDAAIVAASKECVIIRKERKSSFNKYQTSLKIKKIFAKTHLPLEKLFFEEYKSELQPIEPR